MPSGNGFGHPTGISGELKRPEGDEARPMAHYSQRNNFDHVSGSTTRRSAFRMDYDDSSDFDSESSSDSDGESVILTPASHVHSPLSPTAAGFISTSSQSSNTVTYPCHPFERIRPALPTQPGMGFSQPTHPGMGLPLPIGPDIGSQGAALQYGGYAYSPYGGHAHSPLSPKAAPLVPPGSEKMKTLSEMTAALKGMDSSAGPHQPHTNTSNAAKTQDPLHMFHALNSPPNTFPLRTSGMPQPLSIPTATPAFDMDIASKIRNLENLHNCHSKQLATHEHTIKSITKENDNLRSMRDEDRETIQELTSALTKAKSSGADQGQVEYLAKSLCDVRVRLDVLSMKEKSAPSPATQHLTSESKLKLEGMHEVQKIQSPSISAVAGQVGALDKLLQGTGGALNKELQSPNTILVVQAGKIQALESDGKEMRGTIARLQQDMDVEAAELHHVKSRLSDAFDARFDNEYHGAKDCGTRISNQDDEIMHLRSMLDRSEENYESLSSVVEKMRSELAETKAEAGRSLFAHRANATADRERWIHTDSEMRKVQGDVASLQKRALHGAADTRSTLEGLHRDLADLTKRTDEIVVVTDGRIATAALRVTEVENDIAAVNGQIAAGRAVSSGSGPVEHALKLVHSDLRNVKTEIEDLSRAVESLQKEFRDESVDLDASNTVITDEFREMREAIGNDLTNLHREIREVSTRLADYSTDRVSEVAIERIDTELAVLRKTTDKLAKVNEFSDSESTTLEEFVTSAIDKKVKEVQDDSTCKTQTLKGMIDVLDAKFKAVKSERDKRLASLKTQVDDQNRIIYDYTSKVNALGAKADEKFATHDTRIKNFHTHFAKLTADQTAMLGISAKEQTELKKQVSTLERGSAKAMLPQDVTPMIDEAQDANKARTAALIKEIGQVDAAKSALVKEAEQRLNSQIRGLTSRIDHATGPRSSTHGQLVTVFSRLNTLTNDMRNVSQSVHALEGSRGGAVAGGGCNRDRGERLYNDYGSDDGWDSRYDSDDDRSYGGWEPYGQ